MVQISGDIRRVVPVLLIILTVIAGAFAQYVYYVNITSRGTLSYSWKAYQSELRGVLIKPISWYPHDDNLIAQTLADYDMNAVYFQVNPFAWTGLDMSHFQDMIDACKQYGLSFHVLVTIGFECDPTYQTDPHEIYHPYGFSGYQAEWCTYDNTGALTKYPSYCASAARDRIKQVIQTMVRFYPDIVDINLDYIRYQTAGGINYKIPYDEASKNEFLAWLADNGKTFTGDWSDYYYGGSEWRDFAQWRVIPVNNLVREAGMWAREIKPSLAITADVFSPWYGWTPDTNIEQIGQDVADWINHGYLDAVNPMNYIQTLAEMQDRVNKEGQFWLGTLPRGAIPLVPFITTGGSGTGGVVSIDVFIQQVNFLRDAGCNGFILYMYDGPGYSTGWNPTVPYLTAIRDSTTKGTFQTFLQYEPSANGRVISWQTSLPTLGSIEYSTSPMFTGVPYEGTKVDYVDIDYVAGTLITNPTATTQHTFTVPISPPFYYRVIDNDGNVELASPIHLVTG